MSESKTTSRGGIGFCGLLTIVLVTLKLTGYIDWSWLWVFSPILIEVGILIIILILLGILILIKKIL